MTRVDVLLLQIEQTLAECDARRLPPLTSEPAAAMLDVAEQAGLELTPWQESLVRSMYADPDVARRIADPPVLPHRPATVLGYSAGEPIVDEVQAFSCDLTPRGRQNGKLSRWLERFNRGRQ